MAKQSTKKTARKAHTFELGEIVTVRSDNDGPGVGKIVQKISAGSSLGYRVCQTDGQGIYDEKHLGVATTAQAKTFEKEFAAGIADGSIPKDAAKVNKSDAQDPMAALMSSLEDGDDSDLAGLLGANDDESEDDDALSA